MKEQRNPFLLRASEHIEADSTFVRYFGPGALDLLKDDDPLVTRSFISAPGAGKTSLMRLFTPGALLELHKHKDVKDYKDLFARMQGFGVINEDGPRVLGILLSCDRGYANLADVGFESNKEMRLFFALLDVRLLLAAIRQAFVLHRTDYQDGLKRLFLNKLSDETDLPDLSFPCRGDVLYSWARRREDEICAALESFSPAETQAIGSDKLLALDLLKPGALTFDGEPAFESVLIMLDDMQKLTTKQREHLVRFILDRRDPTPVWMAQRMEALAPSELLSLGAIEGRDYRRVHLEDHWREFPKRHENVVGNIADRRVQGSRTVELYQFDSHLENSLDADEWGAQFRSAEEIVSNRVRMMAEGTSLFGLWIAECEKLKSSAYEKAVAWRELEILIERQKRKKQLTLGFELDAVELKEKCDSSLRAAAELFLANEFKLPYYYGASVLAKLSSSNVQQYLALAGTQFEEVISAALISPQHPPLLSAKRQEAIFVKASNDMWAEIPRRAAHGARVKMLLQSIAEYARAYTLRPSAPNDPGVNAVAISMVDLQRLIDREWLKHRPSHSVLAEVLASALAHNLLDAQLNYRCKGQNWMILNLNRLLCVKYRLPLNYGKFKEQPLDELLRWLEKGFETKRYSLEDELL